jgi:dihydrodipicolinate synthase/N-acetylneuraminate lyase
MNDRQIERISMVQTMFPAGIPRLWCPLLTHYRDDKSIDFDRMEAHFAYISPWVHGFLIPGSTGDGWELTEEETLQVTEFAVARTRSKKDIHLLLGLLRADVAGVKGTLSAMRGRNIFHLSENKGAESAISPPHICGITICPPRGKDLTQVEIAAGLSEILDMSIPTALYQLPQVTENEAVPETFVRLTEKYANLIFFKDSSGNDRIASSSVDKGNVFLVRGAEGDYARWLREAGGPYDGFLLSTANCFPREFRSVIENLEKGYFQAAADTSGRLSTLIGKVFAIVQPLTYGNAFTNANKAIDHFLAYGPAAAGRPGPLLHSGVRLPREIISATGSALDKHGFLPAKGYWE